MKFWRFNKEENTLDLKRQVTICGRLTDYCYGLRNIKTLLFILHGDNLVSNDEKQEAIDYINGLVD